MHFITYTKQDMHYSTHLSIRKLQFKYSFNMGYIHWILKELIPGGCCGCERIYNFLCNYCTKVVSLNPGDREVYTTQHNVIKFVSDLQLISGFLPIPLISSINKTDCHDITEILWKVVLNIIIPNWFPMNWIRMTRNTSLTSSRLHNKTNML